MTEQEKIEKIEELVSFADAVVVDTCTLLEPTARFWDFFWPTCCPMLERQKKKLAVPWEVYEELKAIRDNPMKDAVLRARARDARLWIQRLTPRGAHTSPLKVLKPAPNGKRHADHVIMSLFTEFFTETRLVVLTQDRNLATTLIGCAQTLAVHHQPTRIQTLRDGVPVFARAVIEKAPVAPLFPIHAVPSPLSQEETPLPTPTPGLCLASPEGNVTLETQIAKGGEGSVWGTDLPHVAKLYFAMSPLREEKLRKMVAAHPNLPPTIAYPTALLTDAEGRVAGVLMNAARGKPLNAHLSFDWKTDRCPLLPAGFTRLHLVRVARTIVQQIKAMHDCGIIWGDINPFNILLAFPEGLAAEPKPEVWFVDIDCAQIEAYPCLVGMEDFAIPFRNEQPPKPPYNTPMKTLEDDRYALAVLLFKLLMAEDLNPYQQCDCLPQELALKGDFPYPPPQVKDTLHNLPKGHYKQTWKRLPAAIRRLFCDAFSHTRHDGETLLFPSESEWMNVFDKYEHGLVSGWHDIDLHAKTPGTRLCATCGKPFTSFKIPDGTKPGGFRLSDRCRLCVSGVLSKPIAQKTSLGEGSLWESTGAPTTTW